MAGHSLFPVLNFPLINAHIYSRNAFVNEKCYHQGAHLSPVCTIPSTAGNLAIIIIAFYYIKPLTPTFVVIANVAIADFMFCIVAEPVQVGVVDLFFRGKLHWPWRIITFTVTSLWARWRLISRHHDGLFRHRWKKAPCHCPLWGEFTGDRWIPLTTGQSSGKCFHLMRSSWQNGYLGWWE